MTVFKKLFDALFRWEAPDPWAQFEREYEEALAADPEANQRLNELGARIALEGGLSPEMVKCVYPDVAVPLVTQAKARSLEPDEQSPH